MKITRTSIISGKAQTLDLPVTEDQLRQYEQGMLLQDAFPQLTPPQREFIKTGITAEEWKSEVIGENKCQEPTTAAEWAVLIKEIYYAEEQPNEPDYELRRTAEIVAKIQEQTTIKTVTDIVAHTISIDELVS